MVKFSTKLSFDVRLESKRVRETARIISKVLKVPKETIRKPPIKDDLII